MTSLFTTIAGWAFAYRYAALFVLTFCSSLGFPLPAGPSTIAAAALAGDDYSKLFLAIGFSLAGNICGDLTMYGLMRKFGKSLLHRIGLRKFAESPALQNVEQTVNTYRTPIVLASRFQVQATALVNIISGLGRMPFRRFARLIIIGETLQVLCYSAIGYLFAESWQAVYAAIGKYALIVAIIMTVAFGYISTKIAKRKLHKR